MSERNAGLGVNNGLNFRPTPPFLPTDLNLVGRILTYRCAGVRANARD